MHNDICFVFQHDRLEVATIVKVVSNQKAIIITEYQLYYTLDCTLFVMTSDRPANINYLNRINVFCDRKEGE